ncbi:MAG: DUF1080 domain-containing protein [Planctomycetaceae bacterium]|nr:DUF1080 domain-containing protein [Planctomycetaceae bacterium]
MKRISTFLVFALMLLPVMGIAADNELTPKEKAQGWQLLFDGKDYTGWKNNNDQPIASAVEDNAMQTYNCGGYILTYDKPFSDFILKCDVKMDETCNSGIFLRMENLADPVNTGFEIQVLTDKPGSEPNVNSCGSLYDVKAPIKAASHGPGKWDHYEIKFVGKKLNVNLNGVDVVKANLEDYKEPGKRDAEGNHKYVLNGQPRALNDFATTGYIGFQDHGHKCWYKNVKLLEIKEGDAKADVSKQTGHRKAIRRPAFLRGLLQRTR